MKLIPLESSVHCDFSKHIKNLYNKTFINTKIAMKLSYKFCYLVEKLASNSTTYAAALRLRQSTQKWYKWRVARILCFYKWVKPLSLEMGHIFNRLCYGSVHTWLNLCPMLAKSISAMDFIMETLLSSSGFAPNYCH